MDGFDKNRLPIKRIHFIDFHPNFHEKERKSAEKKPDGAVMMDTIDRKRPMRVQHATDYYE